MKCSERQTAAAFFLVVQEKFGKEEKSLVESTSQVGAAATTNKYITLHYIIGSSGGRTLASIFPEFFPPPNLSSDC